MKRLPWQAWTFLVAFVGVVLLSQAQPGAAQSAAPTSLPRARTALVLMEPTAAQGARLAAWARRRGVTVVHVQNEPERSSRPVVAPLRPVPGEPVVTGAQLGALHDELRARRVETLVLAGLAPRAVADATRLGYRVVVAGDTVAMRALLAAPSIGAEAHVVPTRAITELPLID